MKKSVKKLGKSVKNWDKNAKICLKSVKKCKQIETRMDDSENNEYFCKLCNYKTTKSANLDRHNNTNMHKRREVLKKEREIVNKNIYTCNLCNYSTNYKHHYNKHIQTKKHKCNMLKEETNYTEPIVSTNYVCDVCNKVYKTRSGLYKHKNSKCENKSQTQHQIEYINNDIETKHKTTDITDLTDLKNLVLDIAKSNEVIKNLVKDPKIQINNVTNIENYLNIECKDAINMSDFIRQLQITLSDILYLGDKGFSKSVERLLVSSLQDMEQTKRPIHCINKKKKTLYIKDNNVWEKDKEHKKMKQVIDTIHRKELNDTLTIMDKHNEYFEDYENLQTKNNIIISLTGADKDNTLKTITKSISNTTFLQ